MLSYLRRDGEDFHVVVLNFHAGCAHGLPHRCARAGTYQEVFNSDSRFYGGSDTGNALDIRSEPLPWMGRRDSLTLTLPPLGALVLRLAEDG